MRLAGSAVVALALGLAPGCADEGPDARPTAITSTTTTSTTTTSSAPTSSTTTEVPPPGPTPVEQLDGLRPYLEDEGCVLLLERLNAPTFPTSLRDRFASGFSGFVSAAGVVDITASAGTDDAADFDYYGFVSAVAGSAVDQSTWFNLIAPAQPPAGTPMFTVEFTRGADGTFTCEPFENLGGE